MKQIKESYLITGGSGFLGINLARYLLVKGHPVKVLDLVDFDYPEKDRVEFIKGDIRNLETLCKACRGIDIVVHAAAALPLYSEEDIFSIDVAGTRNVFEAAISSKVKRVIHISTTAVYGIPDHHPITENDDLVGVGPYGKTKIEAENICREYRHKGLIVPILRPKSFIGPERLGIFALFYDWAQDGKNFPLPGRGNNRYQLLDVADLCEAIYLAAKTDREEANHTYNIGAGEFATIKDDFQAVLDYAGFGKRIITFPAFPVLIALRVLEKLKLSPLYQWVYETVFKESHVSIERAQDKLDFTPKYSNQEALIRNYQWYLENRRSFTGKSGITHRTPWNQGILKIVKKFF